MGSKKNPLGFHGSFDLEGLGTCCFPLAF